MVKANSVANIMGPTFCSYGPGSLLLIIAALRMKIYKAYKQNPIATGSIISPYICDHSLTSANDTMAIAIVANVTAISIHAKKVLSFAKNTLGSILTGTFLCLLTGSSKWTPKENKLLNHEVLFTLFLSVFSSGKNLKSMDI